MARPPLAKGDDGSGNRYPVRDVKDVVLNCGHVATVLVTWDAAIFCRTCNRYMPTLAGMNPEPVTKPVYTNDGGYTKEGHDALHVATTNPWCSFCVPAALVVPTPEPVDYTVPPCSYETIVHDCGGASRCSCGA